VKFGSEILLDDLVVRPADCHGRDEPRANGHGHGSIFTGSPDSLAEPAPLLQK